MIFLKYSLYCIVLKNQIVNALIVQYLFFLIRSGKKIYFLSKFIFFLKFKWHFFIIFRLLIKFNNLKCHFPKNWTIHSFYYKFFLFLTAKNSLNL